MFVCLFLICLFLYFLYFFIFFILIYWFINLFVCLAICLLIPFRMPLPILKFVSAEQKQRVYSKPRLLTKIAIKGYWESTVRTFFFYERRILTCLFIQWNTPVTVTAVLVIVYYDFRRWLNVIRNGNKKRRINMTFICLLMSVFRFWFNNRASCHFYLTLYKI